MECLLYFLLSPHLITCRQFLWINNYKWQKPTQYCKAIMLQFKKKKKITNKRKSFTRVCSNFYTHTHTDSLTLGLSECSEGYIYHSVYTSEFIFDICNQGNGPGSQQSDLGEMSSCSERKGSICIGLTNR